MAWEPIFPNGNPALTEAHDCRPWPAPAPATCITCGRPMRVEREAEAKTRYLARKAAREAR